MVPSRSSRLLAWIGIPILLLGVLAAVWNWDWFIPVVQSMASKSLGRPVTIGHLHVALGRHITVTADDVVVANPPPWPEGDPPLARVQHLTIETALLLYLRGDGLVLPLIAVDRPVVYAAKQRTARRTSKSAPAAEAAARRRRSASSKSRTAPPASSYPS